MREPENRQCQRLHVHLEAFLDDELEGEELTFVQRHVHECPACQEELTFARAVTKELRELPTIECPAEVLRSVAERTNTPLLNEPAQTASWSTPSPWASPNEPLSRWLRAAVLVAVCGAGILALTFLGDLDRKQQQAEISGTTYTTEELAQAREELRFAFAYLGGITQKAGLVLRDEVLAKRVAEPPRRALSLFGANQLNRPSSTEAL